jgi:hypothetical protein
LQLASDDRNIDVHFVVAVCVVGLCNVAADTSTPSCSHLTQFTTHTTLTPSVVSYRVEVESKFGGDE